MSPFVDSHQHYWDVSNLDYGWRRQGLPSLDRNFLPEELEPQLKRDGIQHSVLVQVLHTLDETRWMLALSDSHPSIAGVVGWVDLTLPPDRVRADLADLRRHPRLCGIRHLVHEELDNHWVVRPDVQRGLEVLAAAGVPFDLLLRPQHLKHAPVLSERHPNLNMVIDHIAKPLIRQGLMQPWAGEFRDAARNPRVWCKLSGMITEADHASWKPAHLAPYVEVALETFGIERLMFGSDWPVCTLAGSYHQVISALREVLGRLDAGTEAAIFGENASRFYGLKVGSRTSPTAA